ncbi:uncharacterized protein K452DRAFT_74442 [Aplosporella prunicola CBS 121167]|uniref:Uncharacterized protein n=1 Tax=Aplosporella prunicola CBS 121167 TaxID=1176127 RepID=A0A6A6B8S3_9PEZI|nr:uncharacterized protein K452DRAFT_74442 [Aplosporella prunicola CBS 121167]KAF2139267.1 hypothetical protein K452DRAFT_74442 [Aplosporella prunicola CBS 121167]
MRLLAATSPPALHVSRPTRSTVSFTATTRPPARTLTARTLLHLSHGVRAAVGLLILALFWAKWRAFFPLEEMVGAEQEAAFEHALQRRVLSSAVGTALMWCVERCDWRGLLVGGVGGLWGVLRRGYTGMFVCLFAFFHLPLLLLLLGKVGRLC